MREIRLACSGYTAEAGNDVLTVCLSREGKAKVEGGIRQGGSPSWILKKDGFLYMVSEQTERAAIGRRRVREDGSLGEEEGRIALPGGELCHLWEGETALYASCYGTGDFFAVDYGLKKILWHRKPEDVAHSHCGGAEDGARPHAHWASQQEDILYLSDLGRDRIYRYRMANGLPEEELNPIRLPEGAGPRQLLPLTENLLLSVQELDGTLRLWRYEGSDRTTTPACVQTVQATGEQGINYPGTACMADAHTVLVCNRGANTVAAFSVGEEKLNRIGEWETGNWPRHLSQVPGTNLVVNACNREGVLNVFAWEENRLQKRDEIVLSGASCAQVL